MPGRHRRPRRNLRPVAFAAAGAAATLMIPFTAGAHASAAVSREAATMRAAQPAWWHAAHVAHVAHLARMASTSRAPAASTGKTWGVSYGYPDYCGDGDKDGWDVNCADRGPARNPDPAAHPLSVQAPAASSGSYSGSGGYQSCVIRRESGGNPRAVNASSGAGGLFQFLPSTWASLGYSGLPQNAPVSVQYQAFAKLYAQAGTSPWSPSDGC